MNLDNLLKREAKAILTEAVEKMRRSHLKSYEKPGEPPPRQRLKELLDLAGRAARERDLAPMIRHCEIVAEERFSAGFDLSEVQTAMNVLEETLWRHILKKLSPAEFAQALGLVSTVFGAGKDALARRYVTLASKARAPSMDLQKLFK